MEREREKKPVGHPYQRDDDDEELALHMLL